MFAYNKTIYLLFNVFYVGNISYFAVHKTHGYDS